MIATFSSAVIQNGAVMVKNVHIQAKRRLSRDYESFGNTTWAQSQHLCFTAQTHSSDK